MKQFRLAHVPFILLGVLTVAVLVNSSKLISPVLAQDTQQVVTPEYNCLGPCPTFTPTPTKTYQYLNRPTPTQPAYYGATATPTQSPYNYYAPTAKPTEPCVAVQPYQQSQPYQQPQPNQQYQPYQQPTVVPYGYKQPTPKNTYQQYQPYKQPTVVPYGYQQPTYKQPTSKNTYQPTYQKYQPVYLPKLPYQAKAGYYNPYTTPNTYTQNTQPRSYGGFLGGLSNYSAKTYGIGSNPNPGYTAPAPAIYQPTAYQPAPNPCPSGYQSYQPQPYQPQPYQPQPYQPYQGATPPPYYQVVTATPMPYYQVVTPTPLPYYVVTATPQPYMAVTGAPAPQPGTSGTPCYADPSYNAMTNGNGSNAPYTAPNERRGYKRFKSHHSWDGVLGGIFRLLSKVFGYRDPYDNVPPCAPAVTAPTNVVGMGGTAAPQPYVPPVEPSITPDPCKVETPVTIPGTSINITATPALTNTSPDGTNSATQSQDTEDSAADAGNNTTNDQGGFLKDFFQFFYFFIKLILNILNGSTPC